MRFITYNPDERTDTNHQGGSGLLMEATVVRRMYGSWDLGGYPIDEHLSPSTARELVVDCFTVAHGQNFGQTRELLGQDTDQQAIRESVQGIIKMAFRQVGGNFDNPSKDELVRVVNLLAERSLGWGTPPDIVFQHHSEMMRTLSRVGPTMH